MKAAKKSAKASVRRDGRKALLTYMKPEIIAALKEAAAMQDLKAWQFVERAVAKALKSKRT